MLEAASQPFNENMSIKTNNFLRKRDKLSEKHKLLTFSDKTETQRLQTVLNHHNDL